MTADWNEARAECISDCFGLDIYALYHDRAIRFGYTVHHIKPLADYRELAVEQSNLIYLSQPNHIAIHKQYKKDFKKTVEILKEYKKRFERDFRA